LEHTYAILAKTRIGACFKATVPDEVRRVLKIGKGDEIVWMLDEDKVVIDKARKEVRK